MRSILVTRHKGAAELAMRKGIIIDEVVADFAVCDVEPGDRVYGTLPAHLVAKLCAHGATYWHLCINFRKDLRGKELSVDELEYLGAVFRQIEARFITG